MKLAKIGRLWPYFAIAFSAVLTLAWSAVLAAIVAPSLADGAKAIAAAIVADQHQSDTPSIAITANKCQGSCVAQEIRD